jgi:hypothetical protein
MYDYSTGWEVGVVRADTVGAYIIVSRRQVTAVSWLLATHRVPHAIEGFVPDQFQDDDPVEAVVRLGPGVEDVRVQQLLDGAP